MHGPEYSAFMPRNASQYNVHPLSVYTVFSLIPLISLLMVIAATQLHEALGAWKKKKKLMNDNRR